MKVQPLLSTLSADPNARAKLFLASYPNGYRIHYHSFFELVLVTDGVCTHVLNGEAYDFTKGDICLLNPASIHQFLPKGDTPATMYTLSFSAELLPGEFWGALPPHALPVKAHLSDDAMRGALHSFEKLLSRSSKEKLPFDYYVSTVVQWIIFTLFDNISGEISPEVARLQPAVAYIQAHFSEEITLADVASSVYMAPEYFSREFHRVIGTPFREYLLTLRLSFAQHLFVLMDMPVSEVLTLSGFRTPSYFSRIFKKRLGLSPEAYRLMCNTDEGIRHIRDIRA